MKKDEGQHELGKDEEREEEENSRLSKRRVFTRRLDSCSFSESSKIDRWNCDDHIVGTKSLCVEVE